MHYLIEYGETGEANIFLPTGMDMTKFIRRFYPDIPEEYTAHVQGEYIEDGMWVKIIKQGYEDTCIFLPSGDTSTLSHEELMSMYVFFFQRSTKFMKKKPPR